MNGTDIDFQQIAPRNGSQRDAFEEFCCQVAQGTTQVPEGSTFYRYRGAGGDGGVECVWQLPDGTEWGWQAKYLFDFKNLKRELDGSIAAAIAEHPKLVRYVVCLPFDLTGETGRKGTSQTSKFKEYCSEWENEAAANGVSLTIELASAFTLSTDFLRLDIHGGRRRYWFDETILGDQWFNHHQEDAVRSAGPRYTQELSLTTPTGELFEAIGLTDHWVEVLDDKRRLLVTLANDWEQRLNNARTSGGTPVFPVGLVSKGQTAAAGLNDIIAFHKAIADRPGQFKQLSELRDAVALTIATFEDLAGGLAEELKREHGAASTESASFRQFQAEYQMSFPAAHLDKAREVVKELSAYAAWLDEGCVEAAISPAVLLFGEAGSGKTHASCDIAVSRRPRGLRTIVVYGEKISASREPWLEIADLLGIGGGRDVLMEALDCAGAASGHPLIFILDGLNETRPRSYWRSHLATVLSQVQRYPNIRVCLTCRSTYLNAVLPVGLSIPKVEHRGFVGMEFEACRAFFDHYGLQPPVSPMLQPEFTNPLFLRLTCEAMQVSGQSRIPSGWKGISALLSALMDAKNDAFATEHGTLPNLRLPMRGLQAFVSALNAKRQSFLPLVEAMEAIDGVVPTHLRTQSLTEWLVREGLLIIDANSQTSRDDTSDCVRIAFERLGEHLLANKLLESAAPALDDAFRSGGDLHFCVADADAIAEHAGLVEAISIQLPEQFKAELIDYLGETSERETVAKLTVRGYPWRAPDCLQDASVRLFRRALRFSGFAYEAFDVLLSIACTPSHLDAFWFHEELSGLTMQHRDGFFCGYLYSQYKDHGPVDKLLRAAFALDPSTVPLEVTDRWATVLLWFTLAADRRVRDTATKALVRITEAYPTLWAGLIDRFADIDDEYVVERCFCAAYGTLLRVDEPEILRNVAAAAHRVVFADQLKFQNALIRDHARCILQLAQARSVLPEAIQPETFMPPYKSEWPLTVPSAEDMKPFEDKRDELPRLLASCTDDDFFVYTVSALSAFEHAMNRPSMGRWIFMQVLAMGYGGDGITSYDQYMVWTYGSGRGRRNYAERIGKKYQWIALARLAARLADHVTPEVDEWDPPLQVPPLTYMAGRDIDPSILQKSDPSKATTACWWQPVAYDFQSAAKLTNKQWTDVVHDIPDSHQLIGDHIDINGKKWLALEMYPDWSSETKDTGWHGEYRRIWIQLRSYLVPAAKAEACWRWLRQQQFIGRWMDEGPSFTDGFVGEYPWATPFNLQPDRWHSHGGHGDIPPRFGLVPTAASISVDYGEDAYQTGLVTYHVPTRIFFRDALKWDRIGGYSSADNGLVFQAPYLFEPGPHALLVDREHLEDFLKRHQLALVWTALGEKNIINSKDRHRLTFSRAHMLTGSGVRSSKPVIEE